MNLLIFTEIVQKILKSGGREKNRERPRSIKIFPFPGNTEPRTLSEEKAEKLLPLSEPHTAYLSHHFKEEVKK